MARVGRLFVPWSTYRALRDQLGSVRGVYLRRDHVDRKDDFSADRAPVLLIHGFFQTRNLWSVMEDRLRADGWPVVSFHLGSRAWRYNTRPIAHSAGRVAAKVEQLVERHGIPGVHVVGHSMGGLIARTWIQELGGHRLVRSLTTLGTPHRGTPTAAVAVGLMGFGVVRSSAFDLLPRSRLIKGLRAQPFPPDIPLLSIASRDDLVCPYVFSRLPDDEANLVVEGLGHSELAWDPGVYGHVLAAIERAEALRTPARTSPAG